MIFGFFLLLWLLSLLDVSLCSGAPPGGPSPHQELARQSRMPSEGERVCPEWAASIAGGFALQELIIGLLH